jgi:hypothetical protein
MELLSLSSPSPNPRQRCARLVGGARIFDAAYDLRREKRTEVVLSGNGRQKFAKLGAQSDTPRRAGGLMSWTASKAVGYGFRRRAEARLC